MSHSPEVSTLEVTGPPGAIDVLEVMARVIVRAFDGDQGARDLLESIGRQVEDYAFTLLPE